MGHTMTNYADNTEFNDFLDADGELRIRGYSFPPSMVLFTMDSEAYNEALGDWRAMIREDLRVRVAALHQTRDNRRRLEALADLAKRSKLVPFVGAGATVQCGYPGWTAFLLDSGEKAGEDRAALLARLWKGEFEEVAELVIERMGPAWFAENFLGVFGDIATISGSLPHIAKFSRGFVLTTNFDRALEQAFENAGRSFEDVVLGRQGVNIRRQLHEGRRVCFKLHGDVHRGETRVLTLSEYNEAYGSPKVEFTRALPRNMRQVFTSNPLLFVGCSLHADRTLDLFKAIADQEIEEGAELPRHHAILEFPDSDVADRERFLTDRGIFPIWYPKGEHEYVVDICRLLACETSP
jgi:hypothetical protein